MARLDYKDQRVPLGDVTNMLNQDVAPKKRTRVLEDDECHDISRFNFSIWKINSPPYLENIYV